MFPVLQQFVKFTRSLLTLLQGICKMKWGYIKKVTIIIIFKNYAHVLLFRPTAIIKKRVFNAINFSIFPNCQLSSWLITDKFYIAIRTKHSYIQPFGALECTMIPFLKKFYHGSGQEERRPYSSLGFRSTVQGLEGLKYYL